MEVSAKTQEKITELFENLTKDIYQKILNKKIEINLQKQVNLS